MKFTELMEEALKRNADRVNMLSACVGFINALDAKEKEWETDLEIDSVNISYPYSGADRTYITVYLKEKGSIKKDVGFVIEDLKDIGFELTGDKYTDSRNQTFSWYLKYPKSSFKGEHPRLVLNVDAQKAPNVFKWIQEKQNQYMR